MGDTTAIGWTDKTWNPWMGCSKVSPGCAHCYMFAQMRQYGRDPETVVRSKTKFADPLKWREPARVFTCSWSDWFHEGADAWRDEAWDIIRRTPHLTYQILTKRPERIAEHLPRDWGIRGYPNVWLGVTVENQRFVERVMVLADSPARVRFASCEPLLGYIRFGPALKYLDWVIVGGESGPDHRPMDIGEAQQLILECEANRVPVFVKQDSGPKPGRQGRIPDALFVQDFPKVAA